MNVFQKKQWTRIGLSIVAVIAAALFLTGIIGGKPMTYRIGENDQELTASEQGYKGEVTAHVVLNGDKTVKSLSIDTPDESEGLGKRASEAEFTDQFIGKAGPFTFGEEGIEALSGATVTSNAALKAINRAAAGETEEPAEEQPAEEKPEEEKPAEEKPDEGKPAEEPVKTEEGGASSGLVYGSYMSEKETDFSTIRVTVNTRNDVITDCEVRCDAKEGQTDLVKDEDEEAWAKAIVETQGKEIDTVSGATISSDAVREAVAEIRQQMAGETGTESEQPAEEQPAEEKPAEEQPAETTAKTEADSDSSGLVYGSYMSEKETDFSTIRVTVSTRNDLITDCEVRCDAKEGQTDLVKDENEEAWAKAVVETQGREIDTVAGATISSDAVREAVAEIRRTIAGEAPAAAEQPAETPAEAPAEEKTEGEGTEQPAEEPAAGETKENVPEQAAEEASASAAYGGYLAVKETDFSVIRVVVSTRNGVITGCKVQCDAKEGQTDLVKDEDEEAWAKAVVESQGKEIDTVAGATVSSDAVREAVAEIQQMIAGETSAAAEQAAELPAEEPAEETGTEQPAETPAEEPASVIYGGYLAVKETDFSVIRVTVSTRNGEITGCRVQCDAKEGQTDLVKDEDEDAWAKAIMETQGQKIDTVSGATISSDAVRDAVAEILNKIR